MDRQLATPQGGQPLGPKGLENPVDVHRREAKRISQLFLRQRQAQAAARGKTNAFEAGEEFSEVMRNPLAG